VATHAKPIWPPISLIAHVNNAYLSCNIVIILQNHTEKCSILPPLVKLNKTKSLNKWPTTFQFNTGNTCCSASDEKQPDKTHDLWRRRDDSCT